MKGLCLLGLVSGVLPSAAEPALWDIDYQRSKLEFVASQAGAEFTGGFGKFQADVRFSESELDQSSVEVSISTASVDTRNGERDTLLLEGDWFDAESFPVAGFIAHRFAGAEDNGFLAEGELTIRGVQQAVSFSFRIDRVQSNIHLVGEALLNRLAFGLGTGEWADESLIGLTVRVKVEIYARQRD